jgi:2-polyprenyl-3-methyl-5-hydroxy-6-metoxy-1,4-benzoquinol methylase
MDKQAWDRKYKLKTSNPLPDPAELLRKNVNLISGGRALDIGMGTGQNAIFLATHGCDVIGIDRSATAVSLAKKHAKKHGVSLTTIAADILTYDMPENYFDIILNFYFLERSLIPKIKKSLKKNGLLFFETYTIEQSRFGGPKNPDYLLNPDELLLFFLDFLVLFYYERIEKTKAIASLIAEKVKS